MWRRSSLRPKFVWSFLLFTNGFNYSCRSCMRCGIRCSAGYLRQVVFTTGQSWVCCVAGRRIRSCAFVDRRGALRSLLQAIMAASLTEPRREEISHGRLGLRCLFPGCHGGSFFWWSYRYWALRPCRCAGRCPWVGDRKANAGVCTGIFAGRWLLRPLFHLVTQRSSAELFTLAVLLVHCCGLDTNNLGLSLAFGAVLPG